MASKRNERLRRNAAVRASSSAQSRDPMVQEAHEILASTAAARAEAGYVLEFYSVDPHQLADDLDVPVDGRIHTHGDTFGRSIHLEEAQRHPTMAAASAGFTSPFIAVIRRPEDAGTPVGNAVTVSGADISSPMLHGPLGIIQRVHRLPQMHVAALLGLGENDSQRPETDKQQIQEIRDNFQAQVEAEAVITAGPYLAAFDV